jgi:hypothetical protein
MRSASQGIGTDKTKEQALATKKDLRSVHFTLGNENKSGISVSKGDYATPLYPDTLGIARAQVERREQNRKA